MSSTSISVLPLQFRTMSQRVDDEPHPPSMSVHRRIISFYEISPLLSSVLIRAICAAGYILPLYNSQLQVLLGMTNTQISWYSSMVSIGINVEIVPFYFMSIYGTKPALLIGAIGTSIGYFIVYLAAKGVINVSSNFIIFIGLEIGFASGWVSAAAFITSTTNCLPGHRASVIGVLIGSYTLNGVFYTSMYETFHLSVEPFLLFVSLFSALITFIAYPSNNTIVGENCHTNPLIIWPLSIFLTTCCIFVICASFWSSITFYSVITLFFFMFILLVGFSSLIMISLYGMEALSIFQFSFEKSVKRDSFEINESIWMLFNPCQMSHEEEVSNKVSETSNLLKNNQAPQTSGKISDEDKAQDMTIKEALCSYKFWVLFYFMAVFTGISTAIVSNLDYIADAHSRDANSHISLKTNAEALSSVFLCIGSVCFSLTSDYLLAQHQVSRFHLLTFISMLYTLNCTMLVFVTTNAILFNFNISLAGLCWGGAVVIINTAVLDTFGSKNFGIVVGYIYLGALVGIVVLYNLVSTNLYNYFNASVGTDNCIRNSACFTTTFWIFASLSILSTLLSISLVTRDKRASMKQSLGLNQGI